MTLYIGIVRASAAIILTALLTVGTAFAIPLPSTPPEVDSTPASYSEEPEDFRSEQPQSISVPEPEPQPETTQIADDPQNTTPNSTGEAIDTGTILMIGGVIWYTITIIGIAGGRKGRLLQKNFDK